MKPDDGVQRDGRADDGRSEDHLEQDAGVGGAVAQDVTGMVQHRLVQHRRHNRGQVADEEQHANGYRQLPFGTHGTGLPRRGGRTSGSRGTCPIEHFLCRSVCRGTVQPLAASKHQTTED